MEILTREEIHALQYYQGILDPKDSDPFWSNPKAYVTFNSLFFQGIETEQARVNEGRPLDTAIASQKDTVLEMTEDMIHACTKYDHDCIHVWRVERLVDYQQFVSEGMLTSFLSTSRNGFLSSYEDKYDLVLMDIVIDKEALCIDLVSMLSANEKKAEGEVLIAPYQSITVEELPCPSRLHAVKDGRGNPPAVYCRVHVYAEKTQPISAQSSVIDISAVSRLYDRMNMHATPSQTDIDAYLEYKKYIRQQTMKMLDELK